MNKIYSLLSMCQKAGKLASGEFACEEAIRGGKALLIFVAEDASNNTKKKFKNATMHHQVKGVLFGTKEDFGRTIGKEERAVLAVLEEGFAKKIIMLLEQMEIATDIE